MTPALVRVGALAVSVAVLAVVVALYMGGLWARLGTYEVFLRLPNAGGVDAGAEVMMSGVRIGTVAAVKLAPDEKNWPGKPVRMTLAIRKGIYIPAHYVFGVDQGGLLATRFVSIEPPRPRKGEKLEATAPSGMTYVQPGAEIGGKGLLGLAGLGRVAEEATEGVPALTQQIQDRIDHLAARAEATYLGPRQEQLVHQTLVNISQMTATANRAARSVERLALTLEAAAKSGSPEAVETVKQIRVAATNLRSAAEQINRMIAVTPVPADLAMAGQHIRRAAAAIEESAVAVRDIAASSETQLRFREFTANVARVSAALAGLSEEAEKIVADPQLQQDLKQAIADMRETMSSLRTTASHLEKTITDAEMTDDLKASVHNLRELTETGTEVTEKANRSLDRVDRTMDSLSAAVASVRPEYVTGKLDMLAVEDRGLRATLDLDLFYRTRRPGFWRLGLFDLGDAERLNFQRAIGLSDQWTLRAGVFANKVGIGVDWHPSSAWRAEFEFYDPKQSFLDVALFRSLSSEWQLSLGVNDVFDNAEPFIGLRRSFRFSGSPADSNH